MLYTIWRLFRVGFEGFVDLFNQFSKYTMRRANFHQASVRPPRPVFCGSL